MNYYLHLVKLNNIRNGTDIFSLTRLVAQYNLNYFLRRPALVKMFFSTKYKDQKKLFHPFLNSLAEEVEQCIITGKDDQDLLSEQYRHYTEENHFDDSNPHVNAGCSSGGVPVLKYEG